MRYKEIFYSDNYKKIRNNEHFHSPILIGVGGSHAYGTNVAGSDLDIRGVALNSSREILLGHGFEQIEDNETDTVIYSFKKIVNLLSNCNPNCIEILGLNPEHYIYISDVGQELLNNKSMFLSKRAVKSFGGYANQQLHRLKNASATGSIDDVGKRNANAIRHKKMAKHSMHLVRLYYTCFDILEKETIKTYRDEEHDLLMRIRNGEFLKDDYTITTEFTELVDELDKRFQYAKENTSLPEHPNTKAIEDFIISVHSRVIVGELC